MTALFLAGLADIGMFFGRAALNADQRPSMQLVVRDLIFPITSARLNGGMWDPYWSKKWNRGLVAEPMLALEIEAEPVEHGEEVWEPRLYHDWLAFPSRDWRAIGGRTLSWRSTDNAETEDANCAMYIFEHGRIDEAELVFGARDGLYFEVQWRGFCDIFWDSDQYGERVPFAATARALFTDIRLNGSARDTLQSFRERFALHLDPDDFVQGPVVDHKHAYDDGMKMTSCVFTPKVA